MHRLIFGIHAHYPYKDFPIASTHFHVEISSFIYIGIPLKEFQFQFPPMTSCLKSVTENCFASLIITYSILFENNTKFFESKY